MSIRQQPYQTFLTQTATPDAAGTAIMRFEAPYVRDTWDTVRFVAQVQGLGAPGGRGEVLADAFTRTVANGWGTPSPISPGDWVPFNGAASVFSVTGTEGRIASGANRLITSPVALTDVELFGEALEAAAGVLTIRLLARVSGTFAGGNMYICDLTSNGTVVTTVNLISRIAGSELSIATVSGLSIAKPWGFDWTVIGTSLAATVWAWGTSQPTTPTITATDFTITAAGDVGMGYGASSGSTLDYDNVICGDRSLAATLGITWEAYRYQINPQNLIYRAGPTTSLNPQINFPFYAQSHDAFYVVAYGVPATASIVGHMEIINENPLGEG